MDHYRTLHVSRDADPEVIEKAYRVLARKHHPDRAPASRQLEATRDMQRINEAHRVLSDPVARRAYDRSLPAPAGDGRSAWDTFLAKGLVGMFLERDAR